MTTPTELALTRDEIIRMAQEAGYILPERTAIPESWSFERAMQSAYQSGRNAGLRKACAIALRARIKGNEIMGGGDE